MGRASLGHFIIDSNTAFYIWSKRVSLLQLNRQSFVQKGKSDMIPVTRQLWDRYSLEPEGGSEVTAGGGRGAGAAAGWPRFLFGVMENFGDSGNGRTASQM